MMYAISTTNSKIKAFHFSSMTQALEDVEDLKRALPNTDLYDIQDTGGDGFVVAVTKDDGDFRGWVY